MELSAFRTPAPPFKAGGGGGGGGVGGEGLEVLVPAGLWGLEPMG